MSRSLDTSPDVLVAGALALLDGATALLLSYAVFVGLPTRWWPVDFGAAVVAVLLATVALGLALPRYSRVARRAALLVVGVGLVLVALLALSASYLYGIYGPVGRGGALLFVLVLALVVPYLVVFPAMQYVWITRREKRAQLPTS